MIYAHRGIVEVGNALKRFFTAVVFIFCCVICTGPLSLAEAGSLHLKYSLKDPELCGYVNSKGQVIIPFGKYQQCFTETSNSFAVVYHADKGLIAIDRRGNVLFNVMNVDNGPDHTSEGMFRIIKDNKIGFANMKGKVVIEPKFSAALPFSEGLAAFCEDCVLIREGEHQSWQKGKWGFINKSGKIVIPARYDSVIEGFSKGKAKVELKGKTIIINSNGKEVLQPSK